MPFPAIARRLKARLAGTVVGVHTKDKVAALTFDDGPDPVETPLVLDLLARHHAKATFFLVGMRAARHPHLVDRIRSEGHAAENHSWDHPSLPRLTGAVIADQIRRTEASLGREETRGVPRLVRPPYGDQSLASYFHSRRFGHRVVAWSAAGFDWADATAEVIEERLVNGLRPGAILLLHDTLHTYLAESHRDRTPMRTALERLLAARPDWSFVTLPDLLSRYRPHQRYWVQKPAISHLANVLVAPE